MTTDSVSESFVENGDLSSVTALKRRSCTRTRVDHCPAGV